MKGSIFDMNAKEATEYVTNKIKDLEDDFSHERDVERNEFQALKASWEMDDWNNVLKVLAGEEDDHNNAKCFLEDKITALEEKLIDEKDRVRISYLKYDLDKYNGILELLRK